MKRARTVGCLWSLWVALLVALHCTGCGPKPGARKPPEVSRPAAPPRAVDQRVIGDVEPRGLPDGPDLKPEILASATVGSVQAMVGTALKLFHQAGWSRMRADVTTRKLIKFFFNGKVAAAVDPSRPAAVALIVPEGPDLRAIFKGSKLPRFVAAVPVTGRGEKLLAFLSAGATGKMSTPWGGYAVQYGSETIWIHVKGGHMLLARQPEHVSSGWKLLEPMLKKARPGRARMTVQLARLSKLVQGEIRTALTKMPGSAALKAQINKLVNLFMGVVSSIPAASVEVGLTYADGLTFKLEGHDLRDGMSYWLSKLQPPDLKLLRLLPSGGYSVSVERIPRTELLFYKMVIETAWSAAKIYLSPRLSPRHIASLERLTKALVGVTAASGGQSADVSFVDPKKGMHWIMIQDVADVAVFRQSFKAFGRFASKDLKPLIRALAAGGPPKAKTRSRRRRRRARRKKKLKLGFAVKLIQTRLFGQPVDLIRLRFGKKKRKRKPDLESFLMGERMEMALVLVGSRAVFCIGDNWKVYLTRVIQAAAGRRTPGMLTGLGQALALRLNPGTASGSVFSPSRYVRSWIRILKVKVPLLLKTFGGRLRSRKARRERAKGLRMITAWFNSLLKQWPTGGGLYFLSGRRGGDYFFLMQLDRKESLALAKGAFMVVTLAKQVFKRMLGSTAPSKPGTARSRP